MSMSCLKISCSVIQAYGNSTKHTEETRIVQSVKVVNDLAERGVALIQEFNSSLTLNE